MSELRTRLSSAGLSHVRFEEYDFEFVVGKSRFPCNRVVASFLSPMIAEMLLVDPTATHYTVETADTQGLFESFLLLCSGSELVVNSTNKSFLSALSRELGNCELFWIIENHFQGGGSELSVENAVVHYLAKKSFGGDFSEEIQFIASHFSETHNLHELALPDLEAILADDSLCIVSENSLFDFIVQRGFTEFFPLFELVQFECLSADRACQFVEELKEPDLLNAVILNRLFARLVLPVTVYQETSSRHSRKEQGEYSKKEFVPSDPLNGIIAHLTRQYHDNVHDHNVVTVTSSPPYSDNEPPHDRWYAAKNVADLRAESVFFSASRRRDEEIPHTRNNWICYDFKHRRVIPTYYSIRSNYNGRVNGANLKSWLVEISVNGDEWTEIDHKENNPELNDRDVTRTFEVPGSQMYRFIKLVNIGRNCGGNDALVISSFEVFVWLLE
jgi:hypothetical protein